MQYSGCAVRYSVWRLLIVNVTEDDIACSVFHVKIMIIQYTINLLNIAYAVTLLLPSGIIFRQAAEMIRSSSGRG